MTCTVLLVLIVLCSGVAGTFVVQIGYPYAGWPVGVVVFIIFCRLFWKPLQRGLGKE